MSSVSVSEDKGVKRDASEMSEKGRDSFDSNECFRCADCGEVEEWGGSHEYPGGNFCCFDCNQDHYGGRVWFECAFDETFFMREKKSRHNWRLVRNLVRARAIARYWLSLKKK